MYDFLKRLKFACKCFTADSILMCHGGVMKINAGQNQYMVSNQGDSVILDCYQASFNPNYSEKTASMEIIKSHNPDRQTLCLCGRIPHITGKNGVFRIWCRFCGYETKHEDFMQARDAWILYMQQKRSMQAFHAPGQVEKPDGQWFEWLIIAACAVCAVTAILFACGVI